MGDFRGQVKRVKRFSDISKLQVRVLKELFLAKPLHLTDDLGLLRQLRDCVVGKSFHQLNSAKL